MRTRFCVTIHRRHRRARDVDDERRRAARRKPRRRAKRFASVFAFATCARHQLRRASQRESCLARHDKAASYDQPAIAKFAFAGAVAVCNPHHFSVTQIYADLVYIKFYETNAAVDARNNDRVMAPEEEDANLLVGSRRLPRAHQLMSTIAPLAKFFMTNSGLEGPGTTHKLSE